MPATGRKTRSAWFGPSWYRCLDNVSIVSERVLGIYLNPRVRCCWRCMVLLTMCDDVGDVDDVRCGRRCTVWSKMYGVVDDVWGG